MKRVLSILFICLILLTLTSCKKFEKIKEVDYTNMFSQGEDYYVYIYKPNCAVCERIQDDIYEYFKSTKKDDSLLKIYRYNKGIKENYDAIKCKDYDSDDMCIYNYVGAKSPEEISCNSSPVLIRITSGVVVSAFDEATLILNELFGEDHEQ